MRQPLLTETNSKQKSRLSTVFYSLTCIFVLATAYLLFSHLSKSQHTNSSLHWFGNSIPADTPDSNRRISAIRSRLRNNAISLSNSASMYLGHEIPVGCDENLLPGCSGRGDRAKKWTEMESTAFQKRKKRAEKELEDEESKRKLAKEYAERCDKQEWALTRERNDEMWTYLKEQPILNGGPDVTTTAPGSAAARRLLSEDAASIDWKTKECDIPKPKAAEGGDAPGAEGGTTEGTPQSAVGHSKHHDPQTDIFQRVKQAVARDLLSKGFRNGHRFDAYGRNIQKVNLNARKREKQLSAEERGERYEHLTRNEEKPYRHFREETVSMNMPSRNHETAVRSVNSERRGEMMEYEARGRSRSADGRGPRKPEGDHMYRQYRHYYGARRVRNDGTPLLQEVGGGGALDEYDDDVEKETSVQKAKPKEKKKHVDEGPGDGSDILNDTQDKIDEQDGHDDYDQPVHEDDFDEDPDEE